jgi:hypothetical protein
VDIKPGQFMSRKRKLKQKHIKIHVDTVDILGWIKVPNLEMKTKLRMLWKCWKSDQIAPTVYFSKFT